MKLTIPLKYLINENSTQFVDRELWSTICRCMSCQDEGISFIDENNLTLDTLSDFIDNNFPDNDHYFDDGLMDLEIWDYYDYDFDRVLDYCVENNIPINTIVIPDSSTECRYYKFYRPGFESHKIIDANDYNEAVVSINFIMNLINNADEDKTDTDVMIEISNNLEQLNPKSVLNDLKNWV